jgi:hypothetical protein
MVSGNELSRDGQLGGLLRGSLGDLPDAVGPWTLDLGAASVEDLWLIVSWKA